MKARRSLCAILACALMASLWCLNSNAVETVHVDKEPEFVVLRASGRFSLAVEPHTYSRATSSFPMAAGETVTINAVYSPSSSSVDFGVTDESGVFYFVTAANGEIDAKIPISASGNYRLTIRNNSGTKVNVSGLVEY